MCFLENVTIPKKSASIWEDNSSCIMMSKNPTNRDRSRHVDVKVGFKTVITVKLVKCAGTQTVSDGLTKTFVDLFRETQGNWEHMWGSSCAFSIQTSEVDLRTGVASGVDPLVSPEATSARVVV